MTSYSLFQNTFILRRVGILVTTSTLSFLSLKPSLKNQKKFKKLEILYQNASHTYIT